MGNKWKFVGKLQDFLDLLQQRAKYANEQNGVTTYWVSAAEFRTMFSEVFGKNTHIKFLDWGSVLSEHAIEVMLAPNIKVGISLEKKIRPCMMGRVRQRINLDSL